MKRSKRMLTTSVIALLLCAAMLVGTTLALFRGSDAIGGNIVTTGKLDVEMHYAESLTGEWKDAANAVIFADEPWQPGHTDVKYVKISNEGNLALTYQLHLTPAIREPGENAVDLAQVIDVYCAPVTEDFVLPEDVTTLTKIGTLAEVMANPNGLLDGNLIPESAAPLAELPAGDPDTGSETTVCLVLKMQEDAGNDYQGLDLRNNFTVQLIATQYTFERGDLGNDYDSAATLPRLTFPEILATDSAAADVVVDGNNRLKKAVTLTGGQATAFVPAGVKLEKGVTTLTLTVSEMDGTTSNITLTGAEEMRSLDVHIEGVAPDNDIPIIITLGQVAPEYLNQGNLNLAHVENGATVPMTRETALDTVDAHNDYYYDLLDGTITVALATFSEVAVVSDMENAWEGNYDYSWYDASKTELFIANADQLAGFGAIVGGMNGQTKDDFDGQTVTLLSDINLGDAEDKNNSKLIFYPIGYYNSIGSYEKTSGGSVTSSVSSFEGIFDGAGHTVANFYQNTWEMFGDYNDGYSGTPNHYKDAMGLFGYVVDGTIKNLTVRNFSSDGEYTPTGVIAAYAENATFENIAITECNPRVYNTGNGGIIGVAGREDSAVEDHIVLKNITVDNSNKISALWGSWDVACGGLIGMYRGNVDGNGNATGDTVSFENCHVSAQIDVYNDVCANYQYYAYRYAGMIIGSVRHNTTNGEGKTIPNMTGISATGCTVNYGDWNDYYYCEFEKNTMASYSEDYQFSRVPHSELNFTDSNSNGVIDADERASVTGCKHIHTAEENHQAVYLPFHQLFTGYGWGVNSVGLEKYSGIVTNLDIIEGDQQESVVKFESKFTGDFLYRVGNLNTVSVGSLFAAKDGVTIKSEGVYVSVTDILGERSMGTYTANTTKWEEGQIQFSETGPVKVTIQDYNFCEPTVLYLEVVDAYNRTTASFGGDSVLLNDVSTSSVLSTSGVIYGNGFTVNMENAPISEKNGAVFQLYDGAVLKNLSIVGKEFTSVAMTVNDTNYGVSAVRAWGTVTIENCYISGCRSAVSVTGTELTIKDSVIANGVYSNVDFRSGILNLHNVTTINEPHAVGGTDVLGLGIVGNMTASAGRQINITGSLTQYNWVSQADCSNIKATGVDSIFESVFTDNKYASLRYTYNGTTYVNTGILSLCSDFGESALTGAPTNYAGMDVTATIAGVSADGYVWAPAQAGTLSDEDMEYHSTAYEWSGTDQNTSFIPPAFNFATAGLPVENGVLQIEYESGGSYTLSKDILKNIFTAKKYGQDLPYTISMNGADYTDKDIEFNASTTQTYTIIYTVKDNLVYDTNGNKTDKTYEVKKELKVFVTVVDKGADAPTFTFYYGTNGKASAGTPHTTQPTNSYASTIKQVGEAYYIMPNVSATSENAIGSKTVDGTTIYYPIVDGINVRSGSSSDYDFTRYYPVFKAVKISDNGTEYTYSGTKEMPTTVSWVSAEIDTGNGASSLNDGFGLYNNQYLCKIQKKAGNAESGGTSVVKYSYTAADGNTYHYYVGYRFYDEDEGGMCVTPDTLVTLANGNQVRVDSLTGSEELLVWNMETGKLDSAPVLFVDNDPAMEQEIVHLYFSDGTDVKVIYEHGFWDYDLNRYVYLDGSAADYIGHTFAKQNGNALSKVKLTDVVIEKTVTTAWSPVTAGHLCYFVNGMLSMPGGVGGLFNIFDVDPATMTYDYEAMARDIEIYGLFTYEEMNSIVPLPEEMFEAAGGAYLKVSIGKGNLTMEELEAMITRYTEFFG